MQYLPQSQPDISDAINKPDLLHLSVFICVICGQNRSAAGGTLEKWPKCFIIAGLFPGNIVFPLFA